MEEVTLNQILFSREERAKKQQELLNRFSYPLICFTMNIAGPVKTSPLIERAFYEGIKLLKQSLSNGSIIFQDTDIKPTGCEAYFSVNCDGAELKKICTHIEDSVPIGRLFDMDVLIADGRKLERENVRGCFVCGASGKGCAASRAHSVSELQSATRNIMESYFFQLDKTHCATLAVESLLDEVHTTPKPGLVDGRNNGSHKDMGLRLFEKSANSLKPYFEKCFSTGKETASLSHDDAFKLLKELGLSAEKTMFSATNGVNTHKGIIYSMGILCASIGRLWVPEKPFASTVDICRECAKFTENSIKKDFEKIQESTAGGRLYQKYALTGIRGEVHSGFDSVLKFGLPVYTKLINKGFSKNDAGAIALLHLIENVKDTNLYSRGGPEGAKYAAEATGNLLKKSPEPTKKEIELLDDAFIEKNLSPGGCADLLAITYFLYALS